MSEREAEERKRERSKEGELAQLARASALHAEGQRFESVILHELREIIDMLETQKLNYRKSKAIHRGS